jgi:hypothetical protein
MLPNGVDPRRGRGMAVTTKDARTAAKKAGKAASEARTNPYVQRLIEDPDLRENVREAIDSARRAYKRMSNGKAPTKALVEDKRLQKELKHTAETLREASEQMRGKRRKKRHRGRRLFVLLIVGGIVAIVVSEGARKTVLDKLFGKEEEFEYSSTTS